MARYRVAYLMQRDGVFYFRQALPPSIGRQLRQREIKLSLRTRDPGRAVPVARVLANLVLQLIASVPIVHDLTESQVTELLRSFYKRAVALVAETADCAAQDQFFDRITEVELAQKKRTALQLQSASNQIDDRIKDDARELLVSNGHVPELVSLNGLTFLQRGVLRARVEQYNAYINILQGVHAPPADPLFAGIAVPAFVADPGMDAGSDRTLSVLTSKFCEQHTKSGEWVIKTQKEYRRLLTWLADLIGPKKQIKAVTTLDVRDFRDLLEAMPKNFEKLTQYKNEPLKAFLTMEVPDRLSAKTIDKYFDMARSFFSWCVDEDYIDVSPVKKIKVTVKASSKDARDPFSPEQLKTIFSSPVYTGCLSTARRGSPGKQIILDGLFWVPLVGLYQGMRLGEIVQTLGTDIKDDAGCPYFSIARAEGEDKQIKTDSSWRDIPVHPALIELGLLEFVASKIGTDTRLFEDIKPSADGYFSGLFTKTYSRYLSKVGAKTKRTSFHSFRHNFKDALDSAGVSDSRIKSLIGHSDNSTTAGYGKGPSPSALLADIAKVSYDIDLTALKAVIVKSGM